MKIQNESKHYLVLKKKKIKNLGCTNKKINPKPSLLKKYKINQRHYLVPKEIKLYRVYTN